MAVQELTQENLRTFNPVVAVKTKQCESYYLIEINCPDDKDFETPREGGMSTEPHKAPGGRCRNNTSAPFCKHLQLAARKCHCP